MGRQRAEKLHGAEAFEAYYSSLFGGRWQSLRAALLAEGVHVALNMGGAEPYYLDPASVCAALCLPVAGKSRLLDLCAAPGGKTLVLAGNMDAEARLFSNERSPARVQRLADVVEKVLPAERAGRVQVSCSDGARWCRRESECYDAVLLDAPCSSERHVLADDKYLKDWSSARIKSLAIEQWALLSCAWRLLAPGGSLLYATCALAPQENGEMAGRLKKKFPEARFASKAEMLAVFEQNRASFSGILDEGRGMLLQNVFASAEDSGEGLHILPDVSGGAGPLFFALVQKS